MHRTLSTEKNSIPAAGPARPRSPNLASSGALSDKSDDALFRENAEGGPHIGEAGPGDGVKGMSAIPWLLPLLDKF